MTSDVRRGPPIAPFFVVSIALLLPGCTRPTLLVCREVTDAGACRGPVSELVVGRTYRVFGTGFGLPRGRAEIRLHETVGGRESPLASARVQIAGDAAHLDHPLTLPHVGTYRVELVDEDGETFRSVTVRAPSPTFHVTAPPVAPSVVPTALQPAAGARPPAR